MLFTDIILLPHSLIDSIFMSNLSLDRIPKPSFTVSLNLARPSKMEIRVLLGHCSPVTIVSLLQKERQNTWRRFESSRRRQEEVDFDDALCCPSAVKPH